MGETDNVGRINEIWRRSHTCLRGSDSTAKKKSVSPMHRGRITISVAHHVLTASKAKASDSVVRDLMRYKLQTYVLGYGDPRSHG